MSGMGAVTQQVDRAARAADARLDEGDADGARKALEELVRVAGPMAERSCFVAMSMARLALLDEEPEVAWKAACLAVRLDPVHRGATSIFSRVAEAMRAALDEAANEADWEAVARLYGELLGAGEADHTSHVAMARAHAEQDRLEQAEALLAATTALAPNCVEAWKVRATVAQARGRAAEATEFNAQARAWSEAVPNLGGLGPDRAC